MREWLTWRTVLGSLLGGLLIAIALFSLTDEEFSLSGLELFFSLTTVISIGLNLWQLFRDRYRNSPLKGALIGLLNDLKSRQLRAHQRQLLISSIAGMALPLEAVRLEFHDFVGEAIQGLEQLKEHVVATIYTLDPNASTQQVVRASEFGLTEEERRLRKQFMDRQVQASSPTAQDPASQNRPTLQ